jgi:hypothetical protein
MDSTLTLMAVGAHPFPLIRGGGLFVICVGLGFLLGWCFPGRWIPLAIGGFVAGLIASALSPLLPPALGSPSLVQVGALVATIVLEMGLIYLVVIRLRGESDRTLMLGILLVVGVHFVIMGFAHGPLMALLGIVTVANAATGLWLLPNLPVRALGIADSLLKVGIGSWMLLLYPTFGMI